MKMPCLLCDKPTEVDPKDVEGKEAPAAFCDCCLLLVDSGRIPWPQVTLAYMMRCQISELYVRIQKLEAVQAG